MDKLNRANELLVYTSVDQLKYVSTSDNLDDNGAREISTEVSQSSDWMECLDFQRTKYFTFEPKNYVKVNIRLVVENTKQDDNNIKFLLPFDNYGSYQYLFRITGCITRLLPLHKKYHNLESSSFH